MSNRTAETNVLQSAADGDMRAVLIAVRDWMDGPSNQTCPLPVELASAARLAVATKTCEWCCIGIPKMTGNPGIHDSIYGVWKCSSPQVAQP